MVHDVASRTRRWLQPSARLALSAAFAALCLAAAHQPAAAADDKVYPGSMCQPHGGAPDIQHSGTSVFNDSATTTRSVTCPFVRDNTTNANGLSGRLVVFGFRLNLNADPLKCTFFAAKADDGEPAFRSSGETLAGAAGKVKVEIAIPRSSPGGPYVMVCSLPPRSRIHAYAATEF